MIIMSSIQLFYVGGTWASLESNLALNVEKQSTGYYGGSHILLQLAAFLVDACVSIASTDA